MSAWEWILVIGLGVIFGPIIVFAGLMLIVGPIALVLAWIVNLFRGDAPEPSEPTRGLLKDD